MDFSVIIPTLQRRDLVVATVRAFEKQVFSGSFEIIVVVDGSTDGTAEALRNLNLRFPLVVIEQPNRGIASARNRGAEVARGKILLFLDDDMDADPNLLAEHGRFHSNGAEVVTGHVPLHPDSPSNFLSTAVKNWAEDRARLLNATAGNLGFLEILGGHLSISRDLFWSHSGFDLSFTRGGTFGNEDRDLIYRLMKSGCSIAFNPQAISRQTYIITPGKLLRQYRQAGAADVQLARKHPDIAHQVFNADCCETKVDRYIGRWIRPLARPLVLSLVESGKQDAWRQKLFWWIWRMEYHKGVRDAGGANYLPKS